MTHTVLKNSDLKAMCAKDPMIARNLEYVLSRYAYHRLTTGKDPDAKYYVCNQDEPYADQVLAVILENQ